MNHNNKITKNLRIGKYIILVSNIVAAIIFFLVYLSLKNIIVLLVVIILIIVAFAIFIYFTKVERKFSIEINDNDK